MQISATQFRFVKICTFQIGLAQVGANQVGAMKVRISQKRRTEIDAPQADVMEIRSLAHLPARRDPGFVAIKRHPQLDSRHRRLSRSRGIGSYLRLHRPSQQSNTDPVQPVPSYRTESRLGESISTDP